ncbi:MAG: Ig-like domain-containing protein [Cytophagaceae bacterium]|nr:Ig-like domain-containing protein [Gemmatimonadaceae bacterium]
MSFSSLFIAALSVPVLHQSAPATQQPSPIRRLVITPARREVAAGDSLRLRAEALDSAGRPVPGVTLRFVDAGGYFEAKVDSTGLVTGGAVGVKPVSVIALAPGAKPFIERVEVRILPGAATRVTLTPRPARLLAGQMVQLEARSFSDVGDERSDRIAWTVSAPSVASVDATGLLTALAPGRARISARAGGATQAFDVQVLPNAVASVTVTPARTDGRQGDVIRFTAVARDQGGRVIEGVDPHWSFSPGKGVIDERGGFVGYEAGTYRVIADFGSHTGNAVIRLTHRDVRRPVTVVGRVPKRTGGTSEVWVHPNGRYVYTGAGSGAAWHVVDVSDPSKPVVVDSLLDDSRGTNDLMTTADGKVIVHTREGNSARRNGIAISTLEGDGAHPKRIAEFTEGVTGGVHSAFVYTDKKHGTHVFLTNNGTGAMHIINIDDPNTPREVAQWKTPRSPAGRMLHDVDVQDGLAYLSYWNDGLIILDVGNGMKGGTPGNPQLASQFKYDLNTLYRDVEAIGGPGFIRGTHTAWRYKNYVIVGDEVAPASRPTGAKDASAGGWFGRLQVIDVSDLNNPKSVAWYEPEVGGVHNIWVAGDTLYLGAYNGGFHAFDLTGELLGDLRAQGREIASLNIADMDGSARAPNTAMTWGVVVKNGLAYIGDIYSGLWIVRIEPKNKIVP